MRCSNCGAKLEKEALYCQDCGHPVEGRKKEGLVRPLTTQTASLPGTRKKKSMVSIVLGSLFILAVVAALFIMVAMMVSRTSPSSSAPAGSASAASAQSASASKGSSSGSSASSASKSGASSKSSKGSKGKFIQADAEEKARKDAANEGMQILSGTIRMTTYGQRAADVNKRLVKSFEPIADKQLALLTLSIPGPVSAISKESWAVETRPGQECIALNNPWDWEEMDGQLVTLAAYPEDLLFPDDAVGRLFSAMGGAIVVAPLTQESAANLTFYHSALPELPSIALPADIDKPEEPESSSSSASAESASSDSADKDGYMLAESNTRQYTRQELDELSDYELFVARNEIYARHGRKFQSPELREFFESKSWYNGTVESSDFTESVLNDVELANASLMLEIEQERGSKYV